MLSQEALRVLVEWREWLEIERAIYNVSPGHDCVGCRQPGQEITIEIRGKMSGAVVVATPFYKRK